MVPHLAHGIPVKGVHTVWLASSVVKGLLLCVGPQCVGVGGCVGVCVVCVGVCMCSHVCGCLCVHVFVY